MGSSLNSGPLLGPQYSKAPFSKGPQNQKGPYSILKGTPKPKGTLFYFQKDPKAKEDPILFSKGPQNQRGPQFILKRTPKPKGTLF